MGSGRNGMGRSELGAQLRSEVLGNCGRQGGFRHGTNHGVDLLAPLEDHQGGDAADAVLAGDVGIFVGV